MTIKIDNNVAIPKPKRRRKTEYMEAIESMKPGQSFLLNEKSQPAAVRKRTTLISRCCKLRIKIATRWTDEGMRIWRVK